MRLERSSVGADGSRWFGWWRLSWAWLPENYWRFIEWHGAPCCYLSVTLGKFNLSVVR